MERCFRNKRSTEAVRRVERCFRNKWRTEAVRRVILQSHSSLSIMVRGTSVKVGSDPNLLPLDQALGSFSIPLYRDGEMIKKASEEHFLSFISSPFLLFVCDSVLMIHL